ncbi:MAG: PQQ-binding-like beta-propeller repeat protein [Planctomycetaceae bacterium]|nr:PQQ-binding-like beta-propeller repeat protein [Planctomycetaceae bacterium]
MLRQLLTVCVLCGTASLPAGDWPAWRGPDASGHITDARVPLNWSADSAAWQTKIPGTGYSSPVVHSGHVFLTTASHPNETDRSVLCLDLATGEQLWCTKVFDSPIEKMHRLNSAASSTPTCDADHVYVTFAENGNIAVAALTHQGEIAWTKRAGTFESRHGLHSCPVVHGDRLLVNGTQDGDGAFVAALSCRTGEILWKTERANKVRSFAAPFLTKVGDTTQVVVSGAGQTIAYDLATGKEIWYCDGPAQKTVSSIVTDGKLLFVPGGREDLLIAIDPTGTGNVTETHIVWKAQKGIPYVPSPILHEGILHLVSDEGIYTSYDAATGQLLKQTRAAGRTSSSLMLAKDCILLTEDSGITHVLKSDGSGTEIDRNVVGATTYASLTPADGALLIRTVSQLLCFRSDDADTVQISP